MASFEKITVDDGPLQDVFFETDVMYVLDDEILPVRQTAAWCRCCSALVASEYVPSILELELLIAEIDLPGNKYLAAFGKSTVEEIRREVNLRIVWRRSRKSPAKCLNCGSADFFQISEDDCIDPVTGKRFRKRGVGFAEMAFHVITQLSPEGEVLSSNVDEVKDAVTRLLAGKGGDKQSACQNE